MFNYTLANLISRFAADHELRYLHETAHYYIKYTWDLPVVTMPNKLWSCVDSGLAGDTNTRRSHTGYVLIFNGGDVSWKSRRQDSLCLSTSEAEFVAASQCAQEVLYRRYFVREVVAGGVLKLVPLRTHVMMADCCSIFVIS